MNTALNSIFTTLAEAAEQSRAQGDKWIVIDCAYQHLDALRLHDYPQVLEQILALVETYPELDYGGPGPFGMLIEAQAIAAYEGALLASLARQPSCQVLGWLSRTMQLEDAERDALGLISRARFAQLLEDVQVHPSVPKDCVDFAQFCQEDDQPET